MARLGTVEQLLEPWRTSTVPAVRRACVGGLGLALAGGLLLARGGTPVTRGLAALALALALVSFVIVRVVWRLRTRDPKAALRSTLAQTEPELARAVTRALGLVERTEARAETGSPELARLHVGRLLGRADLERLSARAEAVAWRWTSLGTALACAGFALVVPEPFRAIEGLDVLFARGGEAPIPMEWLDDVVVVVEPPRYLGEAMTGIEPFFPASVPVGSVLSVRARVRHPGRELVISDGKREVPFGDDGQGGVEARWTVDGDAALRVGARFGQVLVPEPRRLDLDAVSDRTPIVLVEGAPATKRLLDEPRIAIHWEATDDHGLAQVQLVLRAGEREERRELSKPRGAVDRGGIDVLARDKFLDKSYIPVEITVEALDDDPVRGPKWGRSPPIVLVPPQVGELEALRHRALVEARDALTDLLAMRVEPPARVDKRWIEEQRTTQHGVVAKIVEALRKDFGGLRIPGRVSAAARGQLERLDAALVAAGKAPGKPSVERLREATEGALLGFDAVIDALADRDARSNAKKLAEVASEAAAAIKLGREPAERARGERRLAAALGVLEGGGRHLVALGGLGLDLGEIVENGVGRIRRAMSEVDRHHARLAAEDLAARLRDPDPSFASSGGGSMGGTESGGASQDGPASEAAADADGLERALEELRRDHADGLAEVERALEEALGEDEKRTLREELQRLAERTREAVRDLPQQGADPSSARSEAAQARAQGEGMAAALERGDLGQAAENGKRALEALDRAGKRAADSANGTSEHDAGQGARSAAARLRGLVDDAERQHTEQRKRASEAAKAALERAAKRERSLADRARKLRERSDASEAPLPEQMAEKLEDAAREMESAARDFEGRQGGKGVDKQRQAQRLLEMAQPEKEPQEGEREGHSANGDGMAKDADVPAERKDESADRFRRRVTEGLGKKTPPRLRDAVRRYTEGLLR